MSIERGHSKFDNIAKSFKIFQFVLFWDLGDHILPFLKKKSSNQLSPSSIITFGPKKVHEIVPQQLLVQCFPVFTLLPHLTTHISFDIPAHL